MGIGEGIQDLPPGNCFPLENNLHFLHGVSFQKGCYIGQELTARTHHRGIIRKRLMPIFFEREPEEIKYGESITDADRKTIGKYRSSQGKNGLALLHVKHVLQTNEHLFNLKNYTIQTQIPSWWPKREI